MKNSPLKYTGNNTKGTSLSTIGLAPATLNTNFNATNFGAYIGTVTGVGNRTHNFSGNQNCEFNYTCRPVFALEEHITVIRKGPTMPLALEMYNFAEESDVNPTSTGTILTSVFTGDRMDQSSNFTVDAFDSAASQATYADDTKGTTFDGSDISMFYKPDKERVQSGDEIRIPIDIVVTGEDWENGDQLIIKHEYIDLFGVVKTGTCRVEIINAKANRAIAPTSIQIALGPYFTQQSVSWNPNVLLNQPNNATNNNYLSWGAFGNDVPGRFVLAKVMSISGDFPPSHHRQEDIYEVSLVQIPPLFKVKFPRFSYRYKYEDGEYSVFAPWSEIAFMPKAFDYSPKKGYNLGMENDLRSLKVLNWRPKNCPKDVVQIDILYKESNSPNIYTVESFKENDPAEDGDTNYWNTPAHGDHFGKYTIKTELIHQVVASNQLLRPWDNVPRKALSQEVTANRLIFANYLQQYNLDSIDWKTGDHKLSKPSFLTTVEEFSPWEKDQENMLGLPVKSLKSQRTYQLGVVYRDRYGRETPILTSKSGSVEIPKENAKLQNRLSVQLLSEPPYWAESYTFYMKETSNEYYNVAMDRWYDAEDGGIWLSFPSVERNKINEETNLILKKRHDSNTPTDFDVSYKVLAISNNAPKFIKTDNKYWGAVPIHLPPPGWGDEGNWDTGMLYPSGLPLPSRMNIDILADYFDQSVLSGLTSKNNAQVRVVQSAGIETAYNAATSALTNQTKWYDVSNITYIGSPPQTYFDSDGNEVEVPGQAVQLVRISLETAFGNDAMFIEPTAFENALINTWNPGSDLTLSMTRGLKLEARTKEVKDKAQFEGRFFVKILRDANVEANIVDVQQSRSEQYQVLQSKDIKYISVAHPGKQDYNKAHYIDPAINMGLPGNIDPTATYSVSSFGDGVGDATYFDTNGGVTGAPTSSPYWPFGPSEKWTRGVYNSGTNTAAPDNGAWGSAFSGFVSGAYGFENVQSTSLSNTWPSFKISKWSPTNHWGKDANNNQEWLNIMLGDFQYYHFPSGVSSYPDVGILDVSLGNGINSNGSDPTTSNPLSWVQNHVDYSQSNYNSCSGYLPGANPFQIPAIWGDQSHLLVTQDVNATAWNLKPLVACGSSSASWPHMCQPFMNSQTITMLREDWYNLWRGRDDVSTTWPLGRFHPERWFIDKAGAAQGYSGNGIWEDDDCSYMHISYYGIGSENRYNRLPNTELATVDQPTELPFADAIATVGTQFRFKQDPDQTIYTITKVGIEDNIWNYEAPQGRWGYEDDNGDIIGGSGFCGNKPPPFGSAVKGEALAGGLAFLSDVINSEMGDANRKKLTGGAPYNHRIRYTLKLDKVIGSEGPNAFHPIKNHVDADGLANIKKGRAKYNVGLSPHITTYKGGTPSGVEFYNLNSYWNASDNAGDTADYGVSQQNDISHAFYTANPNAYIGLHERGLNETTIEIISPYTGRDREYPISNNPAIFETEPKEDVGLDIYYAASPSFPINLKRHRWDGNEVGPDDNFSADEVDVYGANWSDFSYRGEEIVRVGSTIEPMTGGYTQLSLDPLQICGVQGDLIWITGNYTTDVVVNDVWSNYTPAALEIGTKIRISWKGEGTYYGGQNDMEWTELYITEKLDFHIYRIGNAEGRAETHKFRHGLGYYNCYSYGTGVESNRVRDDYNAVTIDKGVKASMPLAEQYEEERRGSSLIFSGIYNSTSGINRTNQFIQAEPITKDLNPINGSIQKLFTRDTDLVTFCENKVFKILAKKDALFNADGNTNVTSNQAVLGQAVPFVGEYGISKNPESFASESYRVYFADKNRGAVLRLSRDGLTPISDQGMKDWFKDNLEYASSVIGSYDDRKNHYNLTLETGDRDGNVFAYTVSYTEKNKGWESFKSFIQQGGISHKNVYYTWPSNNYNTIDADDPWGIPYKGGVSYDFGVASSAETYQHDLDLKITRVVGAQTLTATGGGTVGYLSVGGGQPIIQGMLVTGDGIPADTIVEYVNPMASQIELRVQAAEFWGTVPTVPGSTQQAGTQTGNNPVIHIKANTVLTFTMARNRFYDNPLDHYSMVKVMFNGDQGSIKRYRTLNYEGTQAQVGLDNNVKGNDSNYYVVEENVIGQEYYDNYPKKGWHVARIKTDSQEGTVKDFIDKENKWFNYIKGYGNAGNGDFLDTAEFSLQGLGYASGSKIIK